MAKNHSQSVAVVIPNWNGAYRLEKCLNSLFGQSFNDLLVLVVDNASKDNSLEVLKDYQKKHENLEILENKKNLGFAGGVNTGIKWAMENNFWAVALFNNDAVADKDWLKNLIKALKDQPQVGIATGLLLHADGKTIDSTGDFVSAWGLPFPRNRGDEVKKAPKSGFVFSASGGASLYRTFLFEKIGLFDEKYFAYYEDVDISFRAQLTGHKVYYTKSAVAYHERGETSDSLPGFTVKQTFRNLPMLIIKNIPAPLLSTVLPRFVLAYVLFFANALRRLKVWAAIKGVAQGVFLVFYALFAREKIQKSREVPVSYIEDMLWPGLPPEQTGLKRFRSIFIREKN